MFTNIKRWWYREKVNRWLLQAYDPLLAVRDIAVREHTTLVNTLSFLSDIQEHLQSSEHKTERQTVQDRWLALKLDPILEHYRIAIAKLNNLINDMPEESRNNMEISE